jgi:predicted kinase
MPRLVITRGLPGAGKTTKARAWVAEDPAGRARVNRDDLRAMLHDSVWRGHDTEVQIVNARDALIGTLLRGGTDVVCDDTNLPQATVRDLARIAAMCGADIEIWDFTDVSVEVCVAQDRDREGGVGETVIRNLHRRFLAGHDHPLPVPTIRLSVAEQVEALPYRPRAGTPPAILVDLDGTVALIEHRSPYDVTRVHLDQPNVAVITAVRAMHAAGHQVVFCSGRSEAGRAATLAWLDEFVGVPPAALFMRPVGDHRRDSVVKREMFDLHIRDHWHIVAVFDDRQQVVDAWRELGLTVFQVAPGDF